MSSLFTNYFSVQNAMNFEQFVTGVYGNLYLAIGRVADWPNNDTTITVPTSSANTFYDFWNSAVAFKKVTASDMQLVIPRVDWVKGNTYIAYHQDTDLFKKSSPTQIGYDYQFYVRNINDQVFKCLANNITANTATAKSTVMPEISLGGQLPENAYIQTADGYKWKYMYTIPPGLKQKFFTKNYMPIVEDVAVNASAVDGRLDVFKISSRGSGYNSNTAASSKQMITIAGDGSNAKLTTQLTVSATANNGAYVNDINIISAGSGYTTATITLIDENRTSTNNAIVEVIIGPPGGHGSDAIRELGASNLMICSEITGDEDGTFPLSAYEVHGIRQIGLILDPTLKATGAIAGDTKYRATNKYVLSNYRAFAHDELVYQGNVNSPSFTGVVEHYSNGVLYLSNITGTISLSLQLRGVVSGGTGSIVSYESSVLKKYSGNLLYIENTSEIIRAIDETVQFKFVLRF